MSKIIKNPGVSQCQKTLAVSDGELNTVKLTASGASLNYGSSLPKVQEGNSKLGKVASWAVSFERLLEDPNGVKYFTAFLKSEVSAENILFWQACERYRKIPGSCKDELAKEGRAIYDTYLSNTAIYAINIDDKARVQECDLQLPNPNMFHKAQQQIFKLMKFDSYTRFIRSPLFQNCMLSNVEGRQLPELGKPPRSSVERKTEANVSPFTSDKRKKKAKPVKYLPFNAEDDEAGKKRLPEKKAWDKRHEKRGSWGAELSDHYAALRTESPSPFRSLGSHETASFNKSETRNRSHSDQDQEDAAARRAEKYCCVFFPDGTASLAIARSGVTVRTMLGGLCERRGICLSDVALYLKGKDKQPFSLDQDSSVLKEQQVILHLNVTFTVEITMTGKTVHITTNGSETLQEALSELLEKHLLRSQETTVTISGTKEQLDMNMCICSLANKRLTLDRAKSSVVRRDMQSNSQRTPVRFEEAITDIPLSMQRIRSRNRNPALRRNYDMDGLMDLLNRTQISSVDDQRGLLRKEHLELPQFLQLPLQDCEEEAHRERAHSAPGSTSPAPLLLPGGGSSPGAHSANAFFCADSARETIV